MATTNRTLTNACAVCSTTSSLSKCQACHVTFYCSREHQVSDRPAHKSACNKIKKAHSALAAEEQALRGPQGIMSTWPGVDLFEEQAGHFWGILETRDYMRARYAVVEALLKIRSKLAVEGALNHILDMLRLCRGDNMGVRDLAPPLFLRLGRDQESYDFVKWWATVGEDMHYDWGNTELPYLDLRGADAFEDLQKGKFGGRWTAISHTASVMLLKLRLLVDLKALQASTTTVGQRLPQEILDNIREEMVSSVVRNNKEVMSSTDLTPKINELAGQVKELYETLNQRNQYFWKAMETPGNHLNARAEAYSHGTIQEMQLALQYCYASWEETPGALEIVKKFRRGDFLGVGSCV